LGSVSSFAQIIAFDNSKDYGERMTQVCAINCFEFYIGRICHTTGILSLFQPPCWCFKQ